LVSQDMTSQIMGWTATGIAGFLAVTGLPIAFLRRLPAERLYEEIASASADDRDSRLALLSRIRSELVEQESARRRSQRPSGIISIASAAVEGAGGALLLTLHDARTGTPYLAGQVWGAAFIGIAGAFLVQGLEALLTLPSARE